MRNTLLCNRKWLTYRLNSTKWKYLNIRQCSSNTSISNSQQQQQRQQQLPASAEAVIIGGGVIGCSTLYHLASLGMTNCVLIEKHRVTSGTTWHTAGLVWHLRPSDTDQALIDYSWRLMKSLEQETGISTGFVQNGGLFTANSEKRLQEYKQMATLGKWFGTESRILTPSEVQQLYPLMNVSDLTGALYCPSDGTIDPAGYCTALVKAAVAKGAKVLENCSVTGIDTAVDDFGVRRVKRVRTSLGDVQTGCIVNAAGVWAPSIGSMANVTVPQVAMKHAYIVTEGIEGVRSMPNTRDHDASVYLRVQGDALCVGGYERNPIFWDSVSQDFAFSLFDLDWDVFSCHVEGAVHRVPAVAEVGVKSTVCGPESFTPDGRPLIGEDHELCGFYHASAFNSGGMMYSGGCSRQLAQLIQHNSTDLDMFQFDVKRFHPDVAVQSQWLRERSHEHYAKHYSCHYHHDQPLAGRLSNRKSPLYHELLHCGCVYEERHCYERPGWFHNKVAKPLDYRYYGCYGNIEHTNDEYAACIEKEFTYSLPSHEAVIKSECTSCRCSSSIFDMSYFGKLHLIGPDAAAAADFLFSASMQREAGNVVYSCLLNDNAGVDADLTVSVINPSDHYYIAVGGSVATYVKQQITNRLSQQRFDCKLIDRSHENCIISVQGPKSRDILSQLTNCSLSNADFAPNQFRHANVAGCDLLMLRVSFVGELGWELHVSNDDAVTVYRAVMQAGDGCIANAGYRAMDILSLEKGYKVGHSDLRSNLTPLECGLAFACKLNSDVDFVGRRALEQQKASLNGAAPSRRLVYLRLQPGVQLHNQEIVCRDDAIVGFVVRSEQAYSLNCTLAVACLHNHGDDGEGVSRDWLLDQQPTFTVNSMGNVIQAKAMLRSPFDPKGRRILGDY